ncbi:MAG: phosphohistidine phosphatase SixA [Proteobacteria bacterium]|jgi:phosphohistidine phosphatase|nr:phosphohistidine phosphatase SixA [Pseudomonadota bacterium]MCG6936541.1 phosphohistidine phosphatase SixA [Pseudomonadota bacterium]
MKLFLVQHGEALSKEIDPDRPLSEAGWRDVQKLADFLSHLDMGVQRVWHSGKTRAEQTAGLLAQAILPHGQAESVSGLAPNDDVIAFAARLDTGGPATVLVGHLPFMARLTANLLVGDPQTELVTFKPGSMVCLEYTEGDGWRLDWMLRPELLP